MSITEINRGARQWGVARPGDEQAAPRLARVTTLIQGFAASRNASRGR